MNEVFNIEHNFNQSNTDSKIIRIQRNLIMMEFNIEMINKILLYFEIESENQAIDYLTKNSDGLWGHPFVPKLNEDIHNVIINNENVQQNKDSNSIEIIENVKSKINTIKDKGISNIIYYPMNEESYESNELICEICEESEKYHINNNYYNKEGINKKEDLIEDLKIEENKNRINYEFNNFNKSNHINIKNISNKDNLIMNEENHNSIIKDNIANNNKTNKNICSNKECPICLSDIEYEIELQNCLH